MAQIDQRFGLSGAESMEAAEQGGLTLKKHGELVMIDQPQTGEVRKL